MGIDYRAKSVVGIRLTGLVYERREVETTLYDQHTGKPYQTTSWRHGVTFNDKFYDFYDGGSDDDYEALVKALEAHYGLPFNPVDNDYTIHGYIGILLDKEATCQEIEQEFAEVEYALGADHDIRLHTYVYIDA